MLVQNPASHEAVVTNVLRAGGRRGEAVLGVGSGEGRPLPLMSGVTTGKSKLLSQAGSLILTYPQSCPLHNPGVVPRQLRSRLVDQSGSSRKQMALPLG